MYEKIQERLSKQITLQHNSPDIAVKTEVNKGRGETRVCYTANFQDPEWEGLKTAVLIQTVVKEKIRDKLTNQTKLKETINQSYFISSQKKSTEYYLNLKRKHWSVEAFHYIKDITYKEDVTKITKGNSPQNYSCLRSLAIAIYKSIGSQNQAQSIRLFSNKIRKLFNLIQSF